MRKILILTLLVLTLNGCISSMARDATQSAISEASKQVRLKWSEEWKPALVAEAKTWAGKAKEEAVQSAMIELEKYKRENEGRLERIGVKVETFDTNKDGKISGTETLALLKEIKAKNDQSEKPLEWWEILLAVGAAYVPLTGVKELARKKMGKSKIKED